MKFSINRKLRKLRAILAKVNAYKDEMSALTDEELQAKTDEFKERLKAGETLDDLLPEAFAVAREADKRVLGMFPFDVQVMGGIVLHQGNIAEMKTGEGKTLTATLPVYLNALTGEGVMLITTNPYLARRDAEEMGQVYRFLGLTIALPFADDDDEDSNMSVDDKREAYQADIVYTTNSGLGFDYLADNLASNKDGKFLPNFNYAIIDEVDEVLLDSAQTPLIISGAPRVQSNFYAVIDTLMTTMVEGEDYIFKEEKGEVWFTKKGAHEAERFLGVENLYDEKNSHLVRHLVLSLRAHKLFTKDKDYIVRPGKKGKEVVLLDTGAGRLMEMTKLQGGLHQAIEAKEHANLSPESRAMASVTYQTLYKKFKKISGMTGTGKVAEKEFIETYGMSVTQIPTNRPVQRIDYPDNLYVTLPEKVYASLEYIKHYHEKGNPLLIFAGSVDMSNIYSSLLLREGIPHNLLNANNAAREAQIISESGQMGAVTVASAMAGRGTDIKLGPGVAEIGGLVVIGTERMTSQRIDLQVRGRSGRQGDPGMSKFFVSLEDDVIKKHGPAWVHKMYENYDVADRQTPTLLEGRRYKNLVEKAQKASDDSGRATRKQTLEYAESMNIQREIVYAERDRLILDTDDLEAVVVKMLEEFVNETLEKENFQKVEDLYHFLMEHISYDLEYHISELSIQNKEEIRATIWRFTDMEIENKKKKLEPFDLYPTLLRLILLKSIDDNWVEQVDYLQQLQTAIGSQSASQKNPIVEYYQEAYEGFETMKAQIKKDMVRNLLLSRVDVTPKGDIIAQFP